MNRFRLKHPLLAALIALCAVAALFLAFALESGAFEPEEQGRLGPVQLRAASFKDLTRLGGNAAYAKFKKRVADEKVSEAHIDAHLFGRALFDVVGAGGITTCDAELSYGCYHGFISEAIVREGLSIVSALDAGCASAERRTACAHGIGHGIMEYFGPDRLYEALDACGLTEQRDPLAGCTTGIFMEYNVPLSENQDGTITVATRAMEDAARPYDPCPAISLPAQLACYLNLPQWWNQIYKGDFEKFGRLCVALGDAQSRSACIMGIGNIVINSSQYDAATASTLCGKLQDERSVSRCRAVAATLFRNYKDARGEELLCGEALPEDRKICLP